MIAQLIRVLCPSCGRNVNLEKARQRFPEGGKKASIFCPRDESLLGTFEIVEEAQAVKIVYELCGPVTMTTTVHVCLDM